MKLLLVTFSDNADHQDITFGMFESLYTGDYIGWVDADDFVEASMFQKLYESAIKNHSELVYCDYDFYPERISTKEKWYRPFLGKKDVDFVERNNQPWNKLVKHTVLNKLHIGELFPSCFDEAS